MPIAGKVEKEVADLARWKDLKGKKPGKVPDLKFDLAHLVMLQCVFFLLLCIARY